MCLKLGRYQATGLEQIHGIPFERCGRSVWLTIHFYAPLIYDPGNSRGWLICRMSVSQAHRVG